MYKSICLFEDFHTKINIEWLDISVRMTVMIAAKALTLARVRTSLLPLIRVWTTRLHLAAFEGSF